MRTLHVVLVCHTELDFDGSWTLYERVQPQMEQMLRDVAGATGEYPKITYCLTGEFLSERLDDAFRFIEEGHEVGIHSHIPGAHRPRHRYDGRYAYRLDDDAVLNQDAVAGPLRGIAAALGLPAPRTHVSGMFTFQKTTIRTISDAGFLVDCSLLPGVRATHEASGDFVLADNTHRTEPLPYRPDIDDPWTAGQSPVVELPVSANLGGGDLESQLKTLRDRLQRDGDVDVFQSFWHHFEFAGLGWTKGRLTDARAFLTECAKQPNVVFSTAAEAAAALEASGL
jgi:hypothetical protein